MPHAICPDCDEEVYFSTAPKLGHIVYCPSCDARLEVIDVEPLELDWALGADDDDDEDWDDEWEDDWDDDDR